MSQTAIFIVGIFVFALTIWGTVMAGGVWLGRIAESQDERSGPRTAFTEGGPDEVGGTPGTASA